MSVEPPSAPRVYACLTRLTAVTSVPAELTGFGHRLGYLKPGHDADIVMWDSHPLALGVSFVFASMAHYIDSAVPQGYSPANMDRWDPAD